MKKHGFTMMELIIVIVIGGILAAVMMPRLERDPAREAANQVVHHLQYAQHLAMVNDVYDATNAVWFQKRWLIWFNNPKGYVEASFDLATPAQTVIATDPATKDLINSTAGLSGDLRDFGVTISMSGGCGGTISVGDGPAISFDNLGKPYAFSNVADFSAANATDHAMGTECIITLTGSEKTATISVQPETGYVHLDSVI